MDDVTKVVARATHGTGKCCRSKATESIKGTATESIKAEINSDFFARMDYNARLIYPHQQEDLTNFAQVPIRWIAKRRKNKGAPRLLETPNGGVSFQCHTY